MKSIHVFTNEIVVSIMISVFDTLTKKCESVCVEIKDLNDPGLIRYLSTSFVKTAIEQEGFYFNKQLIVIVPHYKCFTLIELLEKDYKLIY